MKRSRHCTLCVCVCCLYTIWAEIFWIGSTVNRSIHTHIVWYSQLADLKRNKRIIMRKKNSYGYSVVDEYCRILHTSMCTNAIYKYFIEWNTHFIYFFSSLASWWEHLCSLFLYFYVCRRHRHTTHVSPPQCKVYTWNSFKRYTQAVATHLYSYCLSLNFFFYFACFICRVRST